MLRALLIAIAVFWSADTAAVAQKSDEAVETDISSREIKIESNFTGASIVVFGSIVNSRQKSPEDGYYDLAVVVRGPEKPILTRRKSRVFGIWINTLSRPYQNVPGYYAILSTRPLDDVAKPEILKKYGIGFDGLLVERDETGDIEDPFRDAIIRINQKEGLYRKNEFGAAFIGKSLFRATATLPANVPVGEYWADVFVFSNGTLLSHSSSSLNIHKEGFERVVYNMAFDNPLLYGIVAVVAAVLAGLLASAAFRKD